MPTARETLLEAAHAAVMSRPWHEVRMVDVATAAGVSRQTLYNEFGSKEGLGTALVHRLVDGFLDGAARAAAEAGRRGADPAACCAAAAGWMLRTARDEPIVRGALTGCWDARAPLPLPVPQATVPAQGARPNGDPAPVRAAGAGERPPVAPARGTGPPRRAEPFGPPGSPGADAPGRLAAALRERMVGALAGNTAPARRRLDLACELGLRIALSYVIAPPEPAGRDDEACGRVGEVVRALLAPH